MFLTVHSAAGMVISEHLNNPLTAFLTGLFFHYLFDLIPHGDTKVPEQYKNLIYLFIAGIFDLALMTSYLLIFMVFTGQLLNWIQIFAILGSILPDGFQLLYFIYPQNKYLAKIYKFHDKCHSLISNKIEMDLPIGVLFQIILFAFLITVSLL